MTTSHRTLGQWPNAPLAIVVSQVRFSPETNPDDLCRKIKEAVGDSFSVVDDIQQVSVVIGANGPETPLSRPAGKLLRNDDFTRCIHFLPDSITYYTSEYIDHEHFLGEWMTILAPLFRDGEMHITHCGLRYIDFIIPSEGRVPEDYVQGLGQSPTVLGSQSQVVFNAYDYELDNNIYLRVLYSRGFGNPPLPTELAGIVLPPHALVCRYKKGPSAVLDIDCWNHSSALQSSESQVGVFKELWQELSTVFRKIITDSALSEWKTEQT